MGRCWRRFAAAVLVPLIVAGCGQSAEKASPSQVAARVDSDEITVHQINYVLAHTPAVTAANVERAKRAILNNLIDQELAKQQAVKDKLDRTPEVLSALEQARSDVLARAYLDGIAARQPRPTEAEVKKYYSEHPELFAQRRVFDLDEITLRDKDGIESELKDKVATASMAELAKWLQGRGIKFTENRVTRPAEQIPLELLPKLQAMKDGQIQLVSVGEGRIDVLQLVANTTAPVDEATAAPRIREYLFNRRASEAVAAEMRRLRDHAKITYLGEFAGGVSAAKEPAAHAAPREDQALPPSDEKGVKGLFK